MQQSLPDANRMSVLAAVILLAYALARFVNLPTRDFSLQLPGLYLEIEVGIQATVSLLVAALTAAGSDWLMRLHPASRQHGTLEHWLLPALTAWVIGLPLFQLPLGWLWWAGFAFGGILLVLVLLAEYITIDPNDVRQPAAAMALTAVSYALYLTLASSLRFAGVRLFLAMPALALAVWLVSLRHLHLRLHGRWLPGLAGVVALICAQITAGLHYLPLSTVGFGLALIAPAYALTSLFANLEEGESAIQALREPAIIFLAVLAAALWIR